MKNKISTSILVKEHKVGILRINDIDYISLTDLAMYDNEEKPSDTIIHWMSNISTYNYISLWKN